MQLGSTILVRQLYALEPTVAGQQRFFNVLDSVVKRPMAMANHSEADRSHMKHPSILIRKQVVRWAYFSAFSGVHPPEKILAGLFMMKSVAVWRGDGGIGRRMTAMML